MAAHECQMQRAAARASALALDFFDRKSQSERHFEAGIEETAEAGQSVREELREEQLVAKSFALSVLGRVPQGADGEVPSLSDVLGADRYG